MAKLAVKIILPNFQLVACTEAIEFKRGVAVKHGASGRLRTKALQCNKGLVPVNADGTQGRLMVYVNSYGGSETFELTDTDEVDRRLRISLRGSLPLDVSVENAKLYSMEVIQQGSPPYRAETGHRASAEPGGLRDQVRGSEMLKK